MTQNEPIARAAALAMHRLDVHYALQLGCSAADLRRPGWTIAQSRSECDPTALLFELRPVLALVAPIADRETADARGGAAMVAPELRVAISAVLQAHAPGALFAPEGLAALDVAVGACVPRRMPAGEGAHSRLVYATPAGFVPYIGQWQEWIEPLDEAAETTPAALALLARYDGGAFVVRQAGVIVAFAGLRNVGTAVTEIAVCTEAAALRGRGLGRALLSRATKAVLAADRVPLVRYPAAEAAARRMAERLGYRPYADAVTYF